MPLACIYHKSEAMRVVTFDERDELVASGEWFNHPNFDNEVTKNEKPIRRNARKGRSDSEHQTEET